MDINKAEMLVAWKNRNNDVNAMNTLVGDFYELAGFHCNKYKISQSLRDDYIQEAVERAVNKAHLFDPTHVNNDGKTSAAFSYFYKLIYLAIIYRMRDVKMKKDRRPDTCSYEVISAIVQDNKYDDIDSGLIVNLDEDMEAEDKYIEVDGRIFKKDEILAAAKKAKKLLNKANKNADFVVENATDDIQVLDFYKKLKINHENKVEADELFELYMAGEDVSILLKDVDMDVKALYTKLVERAKAKNKKAALLEVEALEMEMDMDIEMGVGLTI